MAPQRPIKNRNNRKIRSDFLELSLKNLTRLWKISKLRRKLSINSLAKRPITPEIP